MNNKENLIALEKKQTLSSSSSSSNDTAQRIMYNQQARKREAIRYQIIAAQACEPLAQRMAQAHPDRFVFHPYKWQKFPDGTDNIEVGGFTPQNLISGEHVFGVLSRQQCHTLAISSLDLLAPIVH